MYMCVIHKTYMLHSQGPFSLLINKHMKVTKEPPIYSTIWATCPLYSPVNIVTLSSSKLMGRLPHLPMILVASKIISNHTPCLSSHAPMC